MNPNTDFATLLEQAHAVLLNRTASVAQLRDGAEQARGVVRGIDTESESAPQREAQILAGMASPGGPSMDYVLKALASLDDEFVTRALRRKVAVGLAAQLDERVREVEAREAAKPPEQVRREQEHARLEAQREALFARVPVLFRTDFMISKLGAAARSRTPRPVGSHVAYAQDYGVPRVLATQNVMTSTRLPGHWPPRYDDFARLEWPNSVYEEDEAIVGPLRQLCQKGAVSEDEVSRALDRAQATLLREFAQVCTAIRGYYPDGLPWPIALPSFTTPRALAAE
jgi:hypothetical protein